MSRIQLRRGTAAAWTAANPVLAAGELGVTTDAPLIIKLGNGSTAWNLLPTVSDPTLLAQAQAAVVDAVAAADRAEAAGGTGGGGTGGGGGVSNVNGDPGPSVLLTMDDIPETSLGKRLTAAERTKLAGIATGATVNQPDAFLRDRVNHTGAQPISTVTGLQAALDSKTSAASGGGAVYVWRYRNGAWPALPTAKPTGVEAIDAIGPTQPPAPPAWVGNGPTQVPAGYEWRPLT